MGAHMNLRDVLHGNTSLINSLSVTTQKDNNPLRYTQLAAKRTECRRLTNFIKLADYLLIDTLHMLALNSVKDLLQKFSIVEAPPVRVSYRVALCICYSLWFVVMHVRCFLFLSLCFVFVLCLQIFFV